MRNKLKLTFIFIGLFVLLAASANAQSIGDRNHMQGTGGYRITGKVYLPDGRPAPNVTVTVNSAETSNLTSRTNQDGSFEVPGLGAGNYSVSVREAAYKPENESITIAGGTRGQAYPIIFHLTLTGDPKAAAADPIFTTVPKDAVAKFQKGMEKVANDPKAAATLFDDAIAIYPNFAAAYFEKGAALLKTNDIDKALECFVKAIQIKPDYVEAKYSYGYAEYLKKNYEVASAVFDDVLKQKSDMPEAHMYLGISLYYLKNVDAAESQLKLATASESGERVALAHRFLGGIYAMRKQNGQAAAELQKYVDLVPKAPDADKLKATIAELKKQS